VRQQRHHPRRCRIARKHPCQGLGRVPRIQGQSGPWSWRNIFRLQANPAGKQKKCIPLKKAELTNLTLRISTVHSTVPCYGWSCGGGRNCCRQPPALPLPLPLPPRLCPQYPMRPPSTQPVKMRHAQTT
jgi:hypothetical protein